MRALRLTPQGKAERRVKGPRTRKSMTPENTNVATLSKTASTAKPAGADNIVPKKIRILGIPLDLGQTRRGVDMGPSAVRVAGLEARLEALGHVVEDGGNVADSVPGQQKKGEPHAA